MTPAITIQESFLVSAYELPKEITKKVFKSLRNFVANPMSVGLHIEKLSGTAAKLSSIRVDDDYRIIFTMAGPSAKMLYVAKHDLAYRYATSIREIVPADAVSSLTSSTDKPALLGSAIAFCYAGKLGLSAAMRIQGKHAPIELSSAAVSADLDVLERMFEGKYLLLARHLAKREHVPVQLRFSDVEEIIGESLPASARKHRAWWGNESSPSHVQAVAWMGIGWKVAEVDLTNEWVRFER
jgi:hypothetical protein